MGRNGRFATYTQICIPCPVRESTKVFPHPHTHGSNSHPVRGAKNAFLEPNIQVRTLCLRRGSRESFSIYTHVSHLTRSGGDERSSTYT